MSQASKATAPDPRGVIFALAAMAATLWYAIGAWQDIGRRNDMSWAEPAKVESPHCTTYNMVVTWCSARVAAASGTQTVTTLHLLPPSFYDWIGGESKFTAGGKSIVMGLRDRRDPSRVTTTAALEYAGARLGSALTMFGIAVLLLLAALAGREKPQAAVASADARTAVPPVIQRSGPPRVLFGRK